MKTLKELRENIKSVKELITNSDIESIVKDIKDSRIVYRENEYWLVDFKINNTVIIYVFQDGRVIVSYDYISSDYINESMKLYDFIDSLKKEIKNIFFDSVRDKKNTLISDLLDLTGYKFIVAVYDKDCIIVHDWYFKFEYYPLGHRFIMKLFGSNSHIYSCYDDSEEYNIFRRLDTYKQTHKYIKELLENYIKEL